MQNLPVISVNLWQILISLANLVILFFIIKRFLFKPIIAMMNKRQSEIDDRYKVAENAVNEAQENKKLWEDKMSSANTEADTIIRDAASTAKIRSEAIVNEAQEKAENIIRVAKSEAELELKKAADGIKHEIVEVSGELAEKMLEREINKDDHKALIDSFINKIGDENE